MDDPGPQTVLVTDFNLVAVFAAIILLLFFSAVVSAAEVALFSLSPDDIAALRTKNIRKAGIIAALVETPRKLLATLSITNTVINVSAIVLFFSAQPFSGLPYVWLQVVTGVIVITALVLVFGQMIPKALAVRHTKAVALALTIPVYVLSRILSPVTVPLRNIILYINKRINLGKQDFDIDRLSQALELTDYGGANQEEQRLLEGIVNFGTTEASEVMTPRIDVFALPVTTPYRELLGLVIESGYSRIPVYQNSIDQIKGVLFLKDLLPHTAVEDFNWQQMLREPHYVPESKKLDDLLREFQGMKRHFAVVIDEYGDTAGIITLEDVLEEIVGDISDEFDAGDDVVFSQIDDNVYLFEGKISLKDFYRITGIDEEIFEQERGEADTLAGFLIELNGNFPEKGQKINFNGNIFTAESVDNRRIKQIKVTLHETHT